MTMLRWKRDPGLPVGHNIVGYEKRDGTELWLLCQCGHLFHVVDEYQLMDDYWSHGGLTR